MSFPYHSRSQVQRSCAGGNESSKFQFDCGRNQENPHVPIEDDLDLLGIDVSREDDVLLFQ